MFSECYLWPSVQQARGILKRLLFTNITLNLHSKCAYHRNTDNNLAPKFDIKYRPYPTKMYKYRPCMLALYLCRVLLAHCTSLWSGKAVFLRAPTWASGSVATRSSSMTPVRRLILWMASRSLSGSRLLGLAFTGDVLSVLVHASYRAVL